MTVLLAILFVTTFVFTCVCFHLSSELHYANVRIELLEVKTNYCERSEKTLLESVDLQTKCIRDLNDIVKKSVENKEPTEPDTKALLGGWIADQLFPSELELPKEQLEQIDSFRMQNLMNSLCYKKNIWYKYPWQQLELNAVLGPYGIREERMNE